MDKYNIISLTTNIDDLKADMANWCMLPYELRMRSIDDCRRLYNGMSVIDLYNHMKEAILKGKDIMTTEPDNLIRESVATEYDRYDELLAQSKELQKSPYIVILDPDIKDIDELNNKYYSYYLLNDNNKQLSDTYSWKLWGRSIYSMYMTLAAEISYNEGEEEADKSNLVKVEENTFSRIEECVNPLYDFFNEAMMDHDIIYMYKYKHNMVSNSNTTDGLLESMIVKKKNICKELKFDTSILPATVPWFVANESFAQTSVSDKIDTDKFYSELKAELKKSDSVEKVKNVLGYGWNPVVPLNPLTMKYAQNRQAEFFNVADILNIKNLRIPEDIQIKMNNDIYPVFFFFGYDTPVDDIGTVLPNYTKVGVGFKNTIATVYTFDGVDNTFKGFKIESPYDYNYLDVVVFYMDKFTYLKLLDNIAAFNMEKYIKINFNSIFSVLSKTVNKLSPDNMKIVYSRYINMLLKITNIDASDKVPELKQFAEMNNKLNVFKVFSGHSRQFTRQTATNIIEKLNIIANHDTLDRSVTESLGFVSEELVNRLTPVPCIVKHIEED